LEIKSLVGNWKFPLEYHTSVGQVKAEDLKIIILSAIKYCSSLGFNIKSLICDQGTPNQKFFKIMKVSEKEPYFMFGNFFTQIL
jgi:hypothetical protein